MIYMVVQDAGWDEGMGIWGVYDSIEAAQRDFNEGKWILLETVPDRLYYSDGIDEPLDVSNIPPYQTTVNACYVIPPKDQYRNPCWIAIYEYRLNKKVYD